MRPDTPRDPVAGPDAGPESPYPVRLSGPVIKGFGRGSKDVCVVFLSTEFACVRFNNGQLLILTSAARNSDSQYPRR